MLDSVDTNAAATPANQEKRKNSDSYSIHQLETASCCHFVLHRCNVCLCIVSSGARLDYTVIGRDVNLAARVAALCGQLDEPLLLSNAFQARLATPGLRRLGTFKLKGLEEEEAVFAPADAAA